MKPSSAKAKGRRAAQEFRDMILNAFPELKPDDIRVTPSGVTGEDLQLSPAAQAVFPFAVEMKNQERLNIFASLLQSHQHAQKTGLLPLLAFRRNRSEMYVAMPAAQLLKILVEQEKLLHEAAYFAAFAGEPEQPPKFGRRAKTGRALPTASDEE